ncbi:MAG: SDR family NAD(P)-dependent oxidoreductase [Bacteroidales bacterium]|nr:SDR family NAD(P)-dependent oxidoreductase [Bacteroidales bacterium]
MKIKGNTVLITGAASGIGKIMGRIALEKGASRLVIWDINEAAVEAVCKEFSTLGNVSGFKADISDPQSLDAALEATRAACGKIDILINCAGIITNNKPFYEQSDDDIRRTIGINTNGAMFLTRRVIGDMISAGKGHICNITSAGGMLAMPKMSIYAASKWAAIGWSESMRIELEEARIPVKVTTVAPYFINTGMFEGIRSKVFKIQKPEKVAAKTIRAIEKNRIFIGIPFGFHFIRLMQGIFPFRLFDPFFGHLFGLYTVMDHYTGRKK